ncbi:acetyl-CoA C-acyltransferase [Desulfofundulus thermosubterraneus]|uniref:Acetyl-CoA acetyltransferase n=1 Tax=Desulfofundulus thermosubterraneus DSM 16057 TaxID=1121432 RepID=A0A1M6GSN5_9FIRM|nr:acetyl-CoA C-acyltransferase [Desulfofundulus thermosubterraneus]SHJ12951.1 acetyl-CoA acyltransferase [Desulfofundulus thermosubterraneus DSM 16057]
MQEAVIVSAVRTAVGKAPRGKLRNTRPEDMAEAVLKEALARVPGLDPAEIDDVIFGCAFPEAEQGMNVTRNIVLKAGLPDSVPGVTVNRYCSSGLEAIAIAATRIMAGFAEVYVAGGVESMSLVPMGGNKIMPDPDLMERMPEVYMGMGYTAENVAELYRISREDQDAFALASHQKAAAAIAAGKFKDEIVPLTVTERVRQNGKLVEHSFVFDTDEGVRPDTSMEALARLRPAFKVGGTVTAGNSSQTSDGAACVVLMSGRKAASLGLKPLAVFRAYAVGGCPPEIMGIGPTVAIPKALKLAGLTREQIDLFELNEAFASQALACIRVLELDPARINVNGGAIALGHPLGCTGAKLTTTLLYEMQRRQARYGVVSMCIGGGMGAAGVFERV